MDKDTALDIYFKLSLCSLYDMEKEVLLHLGELAEHAALDVLGDIFLQHRNETKLQITRIETAMQLTGVTDDITHITQQFYSNESSSSKGKDLLYMLFNMNISEPANGILKIIQDGKAILSHFVSTEAADMAVLSIGQKVAHFEIASYNSACMLANYHDYKKVADLLKSSLEGELIMEKRLIEIAQTEMHVSL